MNTQDLSYQQSGAAWSNRILLLSLIGIAYLTLFPFRFDFAPTLLLHRYPFLLDSSAKSPHSLDFFLNILLFVPFGFGVSAQARKRGGGRWLSLFLALVLGAGLSYSVELLQFYIPERDSGWEDVISNTTGSVAGFFLFEVAGGTLLAVMSQWEDSLEHWLSPRRVAVVLAAYFAVCIGLSFYLQYQTRLSNWDPRGMLLVGNDASGQNPWKGQILRLQIWDRVLPPDAIARIVARDSADDPTLRPLISYDFAKPAPYRDERNFLPELDWIPEQPQFANLGSADLDGRSWLSTNAPVENLTHEVKKSSQLTVRVVCAPAATAKASGRIVSISQTAGYPNFHLRQQGDDLVFWFRNPLLEKRSVRGWDLRAFEAGKVTDIVASYDGSSALLYVDGNPVPAAARPRPGAGARPGTAYVQVSDLKPYAIVYETLLFLPAGVLIGIPAGKWRTLKRLDRWMLVLAWAVPAVSIEILLAGVSGRSMWFGNIAYALAFAIAGMLLVNADRNFQKSTAA